MVSIFDELLCICSTKCNLSAQKKVFLIPDMLIQNQTKHALVQSPVWACQTQKARNRKRICVKNKSSDILQFNQHLFLLFYFFFLPFLLLLFYFDVLCFVCLVLLGILLLLLFVFLVFFWGGGGLFGFVWFVACCFLIWSLRLNFTSCAPLLPENHNDHVPCRLTLYVLMSLSSINKMAATAAPPAAMMKAVGSKSRDTGTSLVSSP